MEHFPPRNHIPLSEPEIPPHFAAQPAGNSAPHQAPPSQRSTTEETGPGRDHNGQGHSRQIDGTNIALWHEVSNSPTPSQKDPQEANNTQSPPPRTQITYPILPPSPPAIPASEQTHLHPHRSHSYMCQTRDCGWKVAYLKLRRMVKQMMDEKEENVREIRWAVDDMERKMHSEAEFLDELDGRWRDCERAPDAEEGAGESLGGMGSEVACRVESSMGRPPRDGGDGLFDRFVYPDLRSDLSRLEREEDRLSVLRGMGGEVTPRPKSSPEAPPRDRGEGVLGRVVYPTLPSVIFGGETVVDRLA